MNSFPPQIEVAVLQADIFGIVGLTKHWHRQFLCGGLDRHGLGVNLNLSGHKVRIDRGTVARNDQALNSDDRLSPLPVQHFEHIRTHWCDDLGQPVMITQIDKQNIGMFALAVDPA